MADTESTGWKKLLSGYPWYNCDGCFPLPAYSEFMPSPFVGRKPLGAIDFRLFSEHDLFGWNISEIEEEYELRPGIDLIGQQIIGALIKLGKGETEHHIHGHGGQNLRENPYWPEEIARYAGNLKHERYVTFLPMMLSRTQDDKGRILWTFFGNSIHDPEQMFVGNFFSEPGNEQSEAQSVTIFNTILNEAFNEKLSGRDSLFRAGFRILFSEGFNLLKWTKEFFIDDNSSFEGVKYLLTFRPFGTLPPSVKKSYLSGTLNLLPFPGSLTFWGMPGYMKMKKEFPLSGQIPLLNLSARTRGIGSLRVPQAGWFHEPHGGEIKHEMNDALIHDSFHRTHRWQRLHRYQDELNEVVQKIKLARAIFSTDPDALGLYDKPLARNTHIWNHNFELLLNGPDSDRKKIMEAEKEILNGGLFGYRFFYPPMRAGEYNVYWHRPLVAFLDAGTETIRVHPDLLTGHLAGYHRSDYKMDSPVMLWPRFLKRPLYLSALNNFNTKADHYSHQTSLNLISLMEAFNSRNKEKLPQSFASHLLSISKYKTFDQWLDELGLNANDRGTSRIMRDEILKITEPVHTEQNSTPLTYRFTANRQFEERWWNDIRTLAHGEFINKDDADIAMDKVTFNLIRNRHRDLEKLGDYLITRHRKSISEAGLEGKALCGELPFKWRTDFDFSVFGGWEQNQEGKHHERDILVVIPGKNRKEAVLFGDHYDTAYMEDIYETKRGGSGARLSSNGADDNYSASSTLLEAAPVFLKMSKEGTLERDIWLIHLTGEEFPADCMGARNFCRMLIEKSLNLKSDNETLADLSDISLSGVFIMDMIGHNRDNDQDIFQISPGKSPASLYLAYQAHIANMLWNKESDEWNKDPDRRDRGRGKRITGTGSIPETSKYLKLKGEVRTHYNPHSSLFNTDGQIFSDVGAPVVLFMENYDINRTGYHDSLDTLENIDLDYGAALAAIAIETVARVANS